MSILTTRWRLALVVGLCLILGDAYFVLRSTEGQTPLGTGGTLALRAASLVGWGVVVTALVRVWRGRRGHAEAARPVRLPSGGLSFRVRVGPALAFAQLAYGPIVTFSALVLAFQWRVAPAATAGLVAAMLLGWPLLLLPGRIRYEVHDDALSVHALPGRTERVPWTEVSTVRPRSVPFGQQLIIERVGKRPMTLAMPAAEAEFVAAIRRHAGHAGTGGSEGRAEP